MTQRKSLVRCLLLGLLALCASHVIGAQVAKSSAPKLDEFLQGLQSLQADFRQSLRDGQGRLLEESQGVLVIYRPNRFRWEYTAPHQQTIVADGKKLWLYDVDLEQVTVRPMEQSLAGTPAVLLSGGEDLRASFKVESTDSKGQITVVTLAPKRSDTDFKRVRISFVGKKLAAMELSDRLGQSTTLEFANVQRNVQVAETRFVFTPPPGVDVIGDVGSAADGH